MTMGFEQTGTSGKGAAKGALLALLATVSAGIWAGGAQAQDAPAAASAAAAGSTDAMTNLINLLVKQGTITQAAGDALIAQASAEARTAAAAPESVKSELPPAAAGAVRVQYVPDAVRAQIKDELRSEVMAQAKSEGWAAPGVTVPDWVSRIKLSGDFRFRDESVFYSKANATDIINFAAFNAAGPYDLNPQAPKALVLPLVNSTEDRVNRLRIRARLGVDADISDKVSVSFRLATGDDRSPISTNQNLGGGFAKRNIWLDRAYLKLDPTDWASVTFGRMPRQFMATELVFDEDLNFDGINATLDAKPFLGDNKFLRVHAGAYPLDFGSGDYPDDLQTKQKYPSRWMFSGQIEGGATVGKVEVKAAAAYHYFKNVRGQLGEPCNTYQGVTECSSDPSAATFLRGGNTLFFIRNIAVDPNNPNQADPQFVGLAYDFRVLDLNASAMLPIGSSGMQATLEGNYVRNLAFHKNDVCRYGVLLGNPVNNVLAVTLADGSINENPCTAATPAKFQGGGQGFLVRATIGYPHPTKWPEWNVSLGYRYLQSDAVLDAFTDSDFHLGGTNVKGYTIAGNVGLLNGTTIGARWLSANEIIGRPFAVDILQVDLKAEF